LRAGLAVCCLEQDFPILFHTPMVAREVLTCGQCLVASTELIRKLPDHVRLPDGYGCVAIPDVQDIGALSARLAAMVRDPEPIAPVAARGHAFARALQAEAKASDTLEGLLQRAARRRVRKRSRPAVPRPVENPRFRVAQVLADTLGFAGGLIDLAQAREVLNLAEGSIERGDESLRPVAAAISLEIALAEAELPAPEMSCNGDALFRLRGHRWGLADGELAALFPVRDPNLRIITFDAAKLAEPPTKRRRSVQGNPSPRNLAAFAQVDGMRREPFLVSERMVHIISLSDGTRSAQEIAARVGVEDPLLEHRDVLRLIEELFVAGLLWLREAPSLRAAAEHPLRAESL
jgi:hypothetical protein